MNPVIESVAAQLGLPIWFITLLLIWIVSWKGIALWKAAKNNHLIWFIILLVVQSMGLFEILYIFLFSKIDLNNLSEKKTKTKHEHTVQKTSKGKTSK